jgi:hypothetical protein
MKLVVPLTMPRTAVTSLAIIDSRSTLTTGIAAQTLASKRSWTPLASAAANSSAPWRASSCLLAVTTDLPAAKSSSIHSRVGETPPITSATTAIVGSSRMVSKLSVSSPGRGVDVRGAETSRTSARRTSTGAPTTRSTSTARAVRRRSTAEPTVP